MWRDEAVALDIHDLEEPARDCPNEGEDRQNVAYQRRSKKRMIPHATPYLLIDNSRRAFVPVAAYGSWSVGGPTLPQNRCLHEVHLSLCHRSIVAVD
jgi:hypothetical protein